MGSTHICPPTLPKDVNPIDVHVGNQLRKAQQSAGMTDAVLAEGLGIPPHDLLAVEAGSKRLTAELMFEATKLLGVTGSYFFEDLQL